MKFILVSSCIALILMDLTAVAAYEHVPFSPSSPPRPTGPVKISMPMTRNDNHKPNAKAAVIRAVSKYINYINNPIPPIHSRIRTANLTATDYGNDIEYYATISVGTPPQNFKLDMDTGSADLWFTSTLCSNCGTTHNRYNSSLSKTYEPDGRPWSITYGDGSNAGGILARDVVTLVSLAIQNQTIELALSESSQFRNDVAVEGVFGLAFNNIATVAGTRTPVDNLISQGLIDQPIFSVSLGKASKRAPSEFLFGAIDTSKYVDSLKTIPIDKSQGFWGITVTAMLSNTTGISTSFKGILDTGTTLVIFPNAIAAAVAQYYHATDNRDGTYSISCNAATLSPLVFYINDAPFYIPADSLIYQQLGSRCIAGFAYAGLDFAILGSVFLKNNYVVFNHQVPQVQMAASRYQ